MRKQNKMNALKWAQAKRKNLKRKALTNRIFYSLFSALNILIQLTILILASIALSMLLRKNNGDTSIQIVLTSLSAAVIIIIFILNILYIIYQELMKWREYKKILDFIQVELMKFKLNQGTYKQKKNNKELLDARIKEFADRCLTKKKNIKTKQVIAKAFGGGKDA